PWSERLQTPSNRAHDVWRTQDSAVGDRRVRARHLDRRDELALADREVAHGGARVAVERQDLTRFIAGQLDAGGRPEPEPVHPAVESFRPLQHADLDRAA